MEGEFPNKMMDHDKTPKKKAAGRSSNTTVSKKNRKFPPEANVHATNMSSDDLCGSRYDSDGDKGRYRTLEIAQKDATFGRNNSKTPEEEKEKDRSRHPRIRMLDYTPRRSL